MLKPLSWVPAFLDSSVACSESRASGPGFQFGILATSPSCSVQPEFAVDRPRCEFGPSGVRRRSGLGPLLPLGMSTGMIVSVLYASENIIFLVGTRLVVL